MIGLNPYNANAYFNRGCCYDSVGELDLAIADYSTALEIDSKGKDQAKSAQGKGVPRQLEGSLAPGLLESLNNKRR